MTMKILWVLVFVPNFFCWRKCYPGLYPRDFEPWIWHDFNLKTIAEKLDSL